VVIKIRYVYLAAFILIQGTGVLLMSNMNVHGLSGPVSILLLLPGSLICLSANIADRFYILAVLLVNTTAWGLPALVLFVLTRFGRARS
jgi:hypothetical protein